MDRPPHRPYLWRDLAWLVVWLFVAGTFVDDYKQVYGTTTAKSGALVLILVLTGLAIHDMLCRLKDRADDVAALKDARIRELEEALGVANERTN